MLIKVIFDGYSQKVAKIAKKFKDTEIYFNLYSEARTQLIKRPTINFDRQPTQNLIGSSSAMSLSHLESDISQSLTKKSSIISQPSCMEIPKHVNFIEVDPAKEKYRLEVEAQRINNLLKEILNMRKEMWKHYLGTVNHAEMKDQNLTRLLSHESLYAKEIPQAKNKGIFWEESSIRLGSGEDVISHVTPESLKGKSTDQIIASLTIELSQAIISRDQAKSRYDSLQNKFDEFYKKTSADPEVDDVLQKNSTVEK